LLKSMDGIVEYVITDWSLIHWIHYNKINPENTSNVEKTEKKILENFNEFENINIFLERNPTIPYEKDWRIQTKKEAEDIDWELKSILESNGFKYFSVISDTNSVDDILKYIWSIS
jgi:hypothetical protein